MKKKTKFQIASLLIAFLFTAGLMNQNQVFSQSVRSAKSTAANQFSSALSNVKTTDLSNTLLDQPFIYAGQDDIICIQDGSYTLEGISTYTGGIFWETSGEGEFSDPHSLNSTYFPSVYDISNGHVILYLRLDDQGVDGPAIFDQMILSIMSCTPPIPNGKEF